MASVSPPSPSCSTIRTPVRRSPRTGGAFAVSELRRFKQRRAVLPPVAVSLGHVADVVRNDVEFLKNKIGIGIKWANVAFRVPEVTKSAEEVFWLRHLEDSASPPLEQPSLPQPSYSGLTGVDLLMADVKALEAYAGYIYCLSKMWSRPLPEVYDPQAVADYFNCRPHVVAFRLLEVFSAFMVAAIRLRTSSESDKGKKLEASGQKFGMVLKETMLHLGPTFIKVGQSLSTRPDLIGTETAKALSELHDRIPPFPWPEASKVIEEELGAPVESFFSQFSQETVAAASFGQVYRGRTLDGLDVAVKVQRPDLRHAVLRDIYILRLGLGVLRKIAKRESDIRVYADELGKGLAGELDFTLEAANASEFREAHSRFSYIRVPKVYQHLTRKRVLTMEWMVGESPTDLQAITTGYSENDTQSHERQKLEARRRLLDLVNKGVEATLVQLLDTGILHADPHPGNLRYTTSRQIGFLDFGLVCRMERKHQLAMLASIVHIVNGDWSSLVEALGDMDVTKPGVNTRRFTLDLELALGEVELKNGIPDIEFTKVLSKIVQVALKYQLRMPPYFTLVLRSLACLEGLAASGDPNFKTFEAAYPFVVQKLLTENSAATTKILHSAVLNRKKEFRWERVALFLSKSSVRKGSPLVTPSRDETSVHSSSNQTDKDVDTVSLVMKLLASKDGVVLRRLLMAANGTSLIRTFISKEAHAIRQKLCTMVADTLYQWMVGQKGKKKERVSETNLSFRLRVSRLFHRYTQEMDASTGNGAELESANGSGVSDALPPPPPIIPPNVEPVRVQTEVAVKKNLRVPMDRTGFGSKGQKIQLLTNHFGVKVANLQGFFYHYSVALFYDDGRPVEQKGVGRKVLDKVHETYHSDLDGKQFAYDGEKTLFTFGALPSNKMDFSVVLEEVSSARTTGNASPNGNEEPSDGDRKRLRRPNRSKSFRVEISYAAKIPLQALANAMRGQESENSQEAIRVLDIILRQHAARQGCLLVRQSFFHNDPSNCEPVGGNILGCRGFHSSFRTTQGGMSLNMDVTTTMIIKPGPLVDFVIANQGAKDPFTVDWSKAKRTLKNLRIKVSPSNQEYRITGMSDKPCREQTFEYRPRNAPKNENGESETIEITVYDYFLRERNLELQYSADLPCVNVGRPKRPTYIPLEHCTLIPLQRYTKALNTFQRSALVEKSRQKPQERMNVLSKALKVSNYDAEPLLRSCGISISSNFTQVEGRVLPAPKLKMGRGDELFPRNGRWNFNNKQFVEPTKIDKWAVANFSARCNVRQLVDDLIRIGGMKGIEIAAPFDVFEEGHQFRRAPPMIRVEKMFEEIQSKLPGAPQFLLCLLPERKNCDIYGPWKKKNLTEYGIVTQCMAPVRQPNDQYLTNCLLKINAKLGGLNSMLSVERTPAFTVISKVPTIILGMDVSHGSPGQSDVPSIAAVVSSRQWPLVSKYRASVRTQPSKAEMIESLVKKNGTEDDGIIKELLVDFYTSSGKRKPEHIIIFRDGVSESQFNQVLNIELDQIIEACKLLDENWNPKFLLLVAQKNHHTKFFQPNSPDNVPPGTIIDNKICHPKNNDFYLCAHAGMIGTTRPTHYHVLYDEIHFSPDELQELVHSLSYVYQRSTTAISVVAPICYAHLAAAQLGTFMKFEDQSETSSSHGGVTAPGPVSVAQLPKLKDNVANSMFFC